jgi:ribulose-phosphate 3-epimerase
MTKKYFIAPSILSADFTILGQEIKTAEQAGADWIHIDIMDGHFVPNMSMGIKAVEACRKVTALPLDTHLMVREPEKFIKIYAKAGASHLTVHIEATPHIHRLLQQIEEAGCKAGITLNPGTSASLIEPVLPMVYQVLVMTVNPGYGGQQFIAESLPKIRLIRRLLDEVNPQAFIAVDGGISRETLPRVIDAGAQVFIAGNAIFNHPQGVEAGIKALADLLPRDDAR